MKDYYLKIVEVGEVAVVGAGIGVALIGAMEIATAIAAQQWLEARYYINYAPLIGGAMGAITGGMRIAQRRRRAAVEMLGMSDPIIASDRAKLEGTSEASVHLHDELKERLQNSDKQGEIELYYELLCSGRTVGEILNVIGQMQSKSKRKGSAKLERPQANLDDAANVVYEAALVSVVEEKVLSTPRLLVAHDEKSRRTGEPQATKDRWPNGVGLDERKQFLSKNIPGFGPDTIRSSGANTSLIHEREVNSNNLESFRINKFPSIAKQAAFLVLYMVAISSLLIAGVSGMRASRNDERTITSTISDLPSQIGAVAIPPPIAARSEAAVGFLTPQKLVSGSPREVEAGVQETESAIQREGEVSPQLAANQLGGPQRLADPATAPGNPDHEPTTLVIQSPSTTPTGSADTAVHSNTGLPGMRAPPEATPKNEAKGTVIVPTGIASATSLLQAHAVRRHQASILRQYAASRRRIRRPTSVYYGLAQGLYYSSFDRGYSYGGPAPHSDTGS